MHRQSCTPSHNSRTRSRSLLTSSLLGPVSWIGHEPAEPSQTRLLEKVWSEYEVACAQTPRCLELRGVHHTRCVRQCVSPSCYLDIYTHDELEEGEIDVRLPSFKGCFLQRMTRKLHTPPRP
ncbi:hypothetical protein Pmani_034328 [Petrolisthes manimaculis]|uniref:Uncharacterized protein n=1 Tax=Petrolisthes manimaculis TaxID=1843537 RepID=A0AAE1TP90_9EUCA|nr:hypothetical protein Pmani_034328 [Petrolisthes manimaculis]